MDNCKDEPGKYIGETRIVHLNLGRMTVISKWNGKEWVEIKRYDDDGSKCEYWK